MSNYSYKTIAEDFMYTQYETKESHQRRLTALLKRVTNEAYRSGINEGLHKSRKIVETAGEASEKTLSRDAKFGYLLAQEDIIGEIIAAINPLED